MDLSEPSAAQLWNEQQAIDVVQAWCAAHERRDVDAVGALCVDDVQLRIDGLMVASGREELASVVEDDLRRRQFAMRFPVAGAVRAGDGEGLVVEVAVLAALTDVTGGGGASARWSSDRRRVVLRSSQGAWRIASIEVEPGVDADYDAGWGTPPPSAA